MPHRETVPHYDHPMTRALSPADIDSLLSSGVSYRSAITVTAAQATEEMVWSTARGDALRAAVGDMVLYDSADPGGDRWTVAPDIFADTYVSIGGDQYRKTALVQAVQVSEPFSVQTLEGTATGAAGDWLARNPSGECWPITDEQFRRRYVPA